MVKVLTIAPSTLRGGVEEYMLKMSSAAVQAGWEVHTAFPETEKTLSLIQDFTAKGVQYHRLQIDERIRRKLKFFREYIPYFIHTLTLLLQIKPDVVEINLPHPAFCLGSILACAVLRIPTIVRFHLMAARWNYSNLHLRIYSWARTRNQQLVAVSKNNRQLICQSLQIPEQEVIYIYNGSPTISTKPEEERNTARSQLIKELELPSTSQLALTIGRLADQKGHRDLIPTIPHIIQEFPEVRFLWIGDGSERSKLNQLVQEYGVEKHVLFLGYRSDIPKLLQASDLFVFPSHYEGHPIALLEAMAYGLAIVASDASSIPELIENRVHGLLFRTKDSCDLLESLRWALRHPEQMQEMANCARLRAQEFSETRTVQETLDLWEKRIAIASRT